jgi:hypothetical protein
MLRAFLILVVSLVSQFAYAASLTPQLPASEQATYADMLKTNPKAAKEYLITREYVSQCRQVVDNPERAIDLPSMPDDYKSGQVSNDEKEIVKKALSLAIAAEFSKKR